MDYIVNRSTIKARVEGAIARLAASQYSDDGTSLYDSIINSSADESIIDGYIDDAISGIVARLANICKDDGNGHITIDAPEMVSVNINMATLNLNEYIFHSVIDNWCLDKAPDLAPRYSAQADKCLEKAISVIKTRKIPTRV